MPSFQSSVAGTKRFKVRVTSRVRLACEQEIKNTGVRKHTACVVFCVVYVERTNRARFCQSDY